MRIVLAVVILSAVLSTPSLAFAKCASGQPIDYNDVDAVLLTTRYRALDGYLSGYGTAENTAIEGSRFWVLFWNEGGAESPTRYSQFSIPGSIGTYELSASMQDAVAILRRDRFFELAPRRDRATDQTYSVITVRRCSVITRIIVVNHDSEYQDAGTAKVFRDFWSLITDSKKKKVSNDPAQFKLVLIFDQ